MRVVLVERADLRERGAQLARRCVLQRQQPYDELVVAAQFRGSGILEALPVLRIVEHVLLERQHLVLVRLHDPDLAVADVVALRDLVHLRDASRLGDTPTQALYHVSVVALTLTHLLG